MIKKLLFFTIIATCSVTSYAQDLKAVQKDVRKLYAQAMESINQQKEDPNLANNVVVNTKRMEAAVGKCEYTTEYYSVPLDVEKPEDEPGYMKYGLFFVRSKKDYKDSLLGNDYNEYLYAKDGTLAFYFGKSRSYYAEEFVNIETRYYFSKGKYVGGSVQVRSVETGKILPIEELEITIDGVQKEQKESAKHWSIFNAMMNE